jgi:hypothetical protein
MLCVEKIKRCIHNWKLGTLARYFQDIEDEKHDTAAEER